jgi:hypothetical protein
MTGSFFCAARNGAGAAIRRANDSDLRASDGCQECSRMSRHLNLRDHRYLPRPGVRHDSPDIFVRIEPCVLSSILRPMSADRGELRVRVNLEAPALVVR